jgi:hypothetical protein
VINVDIKSRPAGGIWIAPKPKIARLKSIEINLLAGAGYILEGEKDVHGHVNINIQDDDEDWVREMSEGVDLVMSDAFIKHYHFAHENDLTVFRISIYLYMGNMRYKFSIPKRRIRTIKA